MLPAGFGAQLIGLPRFGAENPFSPGSPPLLQRRSFLAQLLTPPAAREPQIGLGDHVTAPASQLEAMFTQALAAAVSGLYARALALQRAAGTLVSGAPPVSAVPTPSGVATTTTPGTFDRRIALSTSSAVAANVRDDATTATYTIEVEQLATAQQNTGAQLLQAQSPPSIATGTSTFTITTAGVPHTISVTLTPGETNLQALQDIAGAINAGSAGVQASVTSTGDVAQLILTGTATGAAAAFSLADVSGNVVAATGIGAITASAQDALVRVNGIEQTISTNQLALDAPSATAPGRLVLTFNAVTETAVTVAVTVALDADQIVKATENLVAAVNDLRRFVADKPEILTQGLLRQLDLASDGLKAPLARIGITVAQDGTLQVDEAALRAAIAQQPGEVERTLGFPNGFASREQAVANLVLNGSVAPFATKPGPLGKTYGRYLMVRSELDWLLLSGLLVNQLV